MLRLILKICRLTLVLLLLVPAQVLVPTQVLGPVQAFCQTGTIDINTATIEELQKLPYIGESRARAIVTYRQEHGPFAHLGDLVKVPGIGEGLLAAIRSALSNNNGSQHALQASASFHKKISTRDGDIIALPDEKYYETLKDFIRGAKHSITLTMFLFKTTPAPGNRPALLVEELIQARSKGVQIHIILEHSGYEESINIENEKVAQKLRRNKIQVTFDSEKTITHAKIVVIDSRYCFVGSHNLSHSALAFNKELSLFIDNRTLASELMRYMDTIH